MVQVTEVNVEPFNKNPAANFTKLRNQQAKIGTKFGIHLTNEGAKQNFTSFMLIAVAQLFEISFIIFLFVQLIAHHLRNKGIPMMDICSINTAVTTVVVTYQTWIMYHYQALLRSLFDRCENFYQVRDDEKWISKSFEDVNGTINRSTTLMSKLGNFNVVLFPAIGIIASLIIKEFQFFVPTYNVFEWMNNFYWVLVFNLLFICLAIYYNHTLFLSLNIFRIIVHHLAGEYNYLCSALQDIETISCDSDHFEQISKKLTCIGRRHSKILEMIKDMDTIFSRCLLAIEMYCVIAIPLMFFSFQELQFLAIALGFLFEIIFNSIYSICGQQIINGAEEFGSALYECDWLTYSPWNRKELALIMLMAQKPVGIRSGGFYFVNFVQLLKVSLLKKVLNI